MVLIQEETNGDVNAEDSPGHSTSERSEELSWCYIYAYFGAQMGGMKERKFQEFLIANGNDVLACTLRLGTLMFALGYLLPISSPASQYNFYSKAFVAAAATNAFRLHQRLKSSHNPTFSRGFLQDLMMEDSAHYLLFSLLFAFSSPVTMALLPIILYAFVQNLNFLLKLANETGNASSTLVQRMQAFKVKHTGNILSTIACAEIVLFPVFTLLVFSGKTSILFPFVYYRFLTLRYMSRRNPYTRETFTQMKNSLYRIAGYPSCPQLIRSAIYKLIYGVERLSPI